MVDGDKLDSVRLNEAAARRLIERATELDAGLATESTVAQLRDAARDAGISEEAFSRALAEVRAEPVEIAPPPVPPPPSASTKRVVILALAVLMALGALLAGMRMAVRGGADVRRAEPAESAPALPPPR